jgi:hypothetical protein
MRPGSRTASAKAGGSCSYSYSYAVIRLVPRVERGECLNVGVILFARELGYLAARVAFDAARLRALAPAHGLDLPRLERQLASIPALCAGDPAAGPLATLPPSERFHWLTAPRSTVIQTTPVHVGRTAEPARTLGELLGVYVGVAQK